ncbi:Generic methyl-transferase [Legionella pneumophila subsp. pneumophila LPE509]|nr:Generic methyl-transferase [Legionella pneumophila subsp. pneumophila LPE509]
MFNQQNVTFNLLPFINYNTTSFRCKQFKSFKFFIISKRVAL